MTLPYPAVLGWRPDELVTTSERLRWHLAVLESQVEAVCSVRRSAAGHWHGAAGVAAQHRLAVDVTVGDDLLTAMQTVRTRLAGVADALAFARSRVRAVVEEAEAHHFRVTVDGTVHPPYLPPPGFSAQPVTTAAYDLDADRAIREAAERTAALRLALGEARLADEHQALTLRALELPATLLDRVVADGPADPMDGSEVAFPTGWDPWQAMTRGSDSEWVRAVLRGACVPGDLVDDPDDGRAYGGTGYLGGGFVTGPDGRRYPLVVPQVRRDGRRFRSNDNVGDPLVEDLLGKDEGWQEVGRTSGIDRFGKPMSVREKVVVGIAGGLGMGVGPGTGLQRRNDLLPRLAFDRLGSAWLAPAGQVLGPSPGVAPGETDPGPADPPGVHRDRGERLGGALALVTDAARAAVLVKHLDDQLTHGYRLTLQQNLDGRRRALLDVYDVYDTGGRDVVVRHHLGYVDRVGGLGLADAAPLSTGAVVRPAPGR